MYTHIHVHKRTFTSSKQAESCAMGQPCKMPCIYTYIYTELYVYININAVYVVAKVLDKTAKKPCIYMYICIYRFVYVYIFMHLLSRYNIA